MVKLSGCIGGTFKEKRKRTHKQPIQNEEVNARTLLLFVGGVLAALFVLTKLALGL